MPSFVPRGGRFAPKQLSLDSVFVTWKFCLREDDKFKNQCKTFDLCTLIFVFAERKKL